MQSVIEKLELIERVHHLIRRRATGSPQEFADKLNISKASLHRHLVIIKILGAPIIYNLKSQTYEYSHDVVFNFGFKPLRELSENEKKELKGGKIKQILIGNSRVSTNETVIKYF